MQRKTSGQSDLHFIGRPGNIVSNHRNVSPSQVRGIRGVPGVRHAGLLAGAAGLQQADAARQQPGRGPARGGGPQPRYQEHRAHRRAEGGVQHRLLLPPDVV